MPPVQSLKNQYRGINAHLHSFWQAEGKWNRFHNYHIGQLMAALKAQLLPMGYTAVIDESLQIRRVGDDLPGRPRSDVLIRHLDPHRTRPPVTPSGMALEPIALDELVEAEEDRDHPYDSIVIHQWQPDHTPGEAVAWLELLSPSNKGENKDAYTYLAKRRLLLERGLVFIELDYLHETAPTFERLPDYARREPGAFPYRIAIIDPRPEYRRARVYMREFEVDAALPTMDIPLNAGDILTFDFDRVYQKTFVDALYGYDMDYAQLPLNFDRYAEADRARIVARMLAVLKAARDGLDLDAHAPLPVEPVPLEDGLRLLATL